MNRAKLMCLALSLAGLTGCLNPVQPGAVKDAPAVGSVPTKRIPHILVIAAQRTGEPSDERAFAAIDTILKGQRTARAGENDKILLVEVSDKGGPLTSGSARAFKAKYPDGQAVKNALQVCPGPTRVYDILSETVDQARGLSKDAKITLVIFASMKDSVSRPQGINRMFGSLIELERHNSLSLRIYGADPFEADLLRRTFEKWLRQYSVATAIDEDPDLPGWNDE